jgi:site-specific DNA recombinase
MTPKAAGIYCRISLDRTEGLGVERQEQLCRKLARAKGWPVREVFVDNNVSASNGARRPQYERLLSDIERGAIDAVVTVDLDRLTRRPIELEEFMNLADARGVALANVSGDTDLSTSDGRLKARILGAVAKQESERKGERVQREAEQAARAGVPRGPRRPFGYEPDKTTIRESEAELVREAHRKLMAGETASTVAADWNARDVPTAQGAAHGWTSAALLSILRNPRVAGLRSYRGDVVAEGNWPAILPREDWETLQGRIRRTARVGRAATSLLSGTARCSHCSSPMWTTWRKNKRGEPVRRYACLKRPGNPGCGRTAVVAQPADDLVRDAVLAALAGPELARARRRARGRGRARDRDAAKVLAHHEHHLEELAADHARGRITRREWLAARDVLQDEIAQAQRELDHDTGPLRGLPGTQKALREAWDAHEGPEGIEWRRALLGAVVDAVIVKPSSRPTQRFDPDRIEIRWRV